MNITTKYKYHGNPKRRPKNSHPDSPPNPEPYIAPPELITAVNLAIHLQRPLLLEGEAGCGKTRLAPAVAYELGLPFYRWDVRSTSQAQDGLYQYDAILRLHDVQIQKLGQPLAQDSGESQRNPSDPKCYRKFGALGKAFQLADCPAVVLIDEIDKADIDFPNDLLAVLDEPWQFAIPETGEELTAKHPPIVIITSNKEKGNLPAPFLRRCLYYFVEFPSQKRLKEIVEIHYRGNETASPATDLVEAATERFLKVRQEGGLFKPPGTSEFLDWLAALQSFEPKPYSAEKLAQEKPLPYRELLFKLRADWQKYANAS
jgi:MoxR-like ATPase